MENKGNINNYLKNALVLAYLGDSVFTLLVREFLVKSYDYKPNMLNKLCNNVVCAKNQAQIFKEIKQTLNQDEIDITMRARNNHLNNNKAKNSTIEEYSLATQFEALIGYWYLNNQKNKIDELFNKYVVEKLC